MSVCLPTSAEKVNNAGKGLGERLGGKEDVPILCSLPQKGAQRHRSFRKRLLTLFSLWWRGMTPYPSNTNTGVVHVDLVTFAQIIMKLVAVWLLRGNVGSSQ